MPKIPQTPLSPQLPHEKGKDEPKEKKPRERKKPEYEGSRWSSLGLLILTVIIGFFLYLSGQH